jgi:excisionase family DNA binding protein
VSDRVTIEEAATRLGVSARTVYRRIAAGDLRTVEEAGRQWVLLEANAGPVGLPGMERMQYAADRAMFDKVSDNDRQVTDTVSLDVLTMIASLEAERDHLRRANDKLTGTVSKLTDYVSELNRTLQGQTIRLAQLEGRVLAPGMSAETPQAFTTGDTTTARTDA